MIDYIPILARANKGVLYLVEFRSHLRLGAIDSRVVYKRLRLPIRSTPLVQLNTSFIVQRETSIVKIPFSPLYFFIIDSILLSFQQFYYQKGVFKLEFLLFLYLFYFPYFYLYLILFDFRFKIYYGFYIGLVSLNTRPIN